MRERGRVEERARKAEGKDVSGEEEVTGQDVRGGGERGAGRGTEVMC